MTKPLSPNSTIPPSVEMSINIVRQLWWSLPTSMGRRRLSTSPITNTPKRMRDDALPDSPRKQKVDGKRAPRSVRRRPRESSERIPITNPQRRAPSMPRNQNINPSQACPAAAATAMFPFTGRTNDGGEFAEQVTLVIQAQRYCLTYLCRLKQRHPAARKRAGRALWRS